MDKNAALAFLVTFVALYAVHGVADYWVQTDCQALHKGRPGRTGRMACSAHVATYVATQGLSLVVVGLALSWTPGWWALPALAVSAVTHYLADRRDYGLLFWLARRLPSTKGLMTLGVPRAPVELELWTPCDSCGGRGTSYDESTNGLCWDCRGGGALPHTTVLTDNPSLGTGSWALDQSWHVALGCFLPALIVAVGAS